MTNLFYPSLAVWYQKRAPSRNTSDIPHAGPSRLPHTQSGARASSSIWSTPLLDSLYPEPLPFLPPLDAGGWWDTDHLEDGQATDRWNGTRVTRRRSRPEYQEEEELRLVRVGWTDVNRLQRRPGYDHDCQQWSTRGLDLQASIQQVVNTWERDHPGSRERCVRELRWDDSTEAEAPCVDVSRNTCGDSGEPSDGLQATEYPSSSYRWTASIFRLPRGSTNRFDEKWARAMQGIAEQQAGVTFVNDPARLRSTDPWHGEWDLSVSRLSEYDLGIRSPVCGVLLTFRSMHLPRLLRTTTRPKSQKIHMRNTLSYSTSP